MWTDDYAYHTYVLTGTVGFVLNAFSVVAMLEAGRRPFRVPHRLMINQFLIDACRAFFLVLAGALRHGFGLYSGRLGDDFLSEILCHLSDGGYVDFSLMVSSVCNQHVLAVERYYFLCRREHYAGRFSGRYLRLMNVTVWLFGFVTYGIIYSRTERHGIACVSAAYGVPGLRHFLAAYHFLVQLLGLALVAATCYSRVLRRVHRTKVTRRVSVVTDGGSRAAIDHDANLALSFAVFTGMWIIFASFNQIGFLLFLLDVIPVLFEMRIYGKFSLSLLAMTTSLAPIFFYLIQHDFRAIVQTFLRHLCRRFTARPPAGRSHGSDIRISVDGGEHARRSDIRLVRSVAQNEDENLAHPAAYDFLVSSRWARKEKSDPHLHGNKHEDAAKVVRSVNDAESHGGSGRLVFPSKPAIDGPS